MTKTERILLFIAGFILFEIGMIGGSYFQQPQRFAAWIGFCAFFNGCIFVILGAYFIISSINGKFLKP